MHMSVIMGSAFQEVGGVMDMKTVVMAVMKEQKSVVCGPQQ